MNNDPVTRLAAAVDAALASDEEIDLEPLWNELGAAIDAAPSHPALRRLRIRLAAACHEHAARHADLQVLADLEPHDRSVRLDLALLQHRWAFLLVDDDVEDDSPDDDESAPDDGPQQALEQQARDWLGALIAAQLADAAFCAEAFARWQEANLYAPWMRLRLALLAAAEHPADAALQRVLAEAWDDLANQSPEGLDPEGPPPMGFVADVEGTLWDPFMAQRALDAFDALLQRTPGDGELHRRRARLLEATCDFPAAADAYEAAANALDRSAQTAADAAGREAIAAEAEAARERAGLCRAGRAALAHASVSALEGLMAQLGQAMPAREGASPEAQAFRDEWEAGRQERMSGLAGDFEALMQQQAGAAEGPDDEQLAQMDQVAAQVGAGVVGSLQIDPLNMVPVTPAQFEDDWETALAPFLDAMRALGWQPLGWAEWPDFRAMLGHQAVSSIWCDAATGTVALGFMAHGALSIDLETELQDGRIVVTSPSRGRNFLIGGPDVDTLLVEPALAIEEACALHLARVRWCCVQPPRTAPRPCASLQEAFALQERGRVAKLRFRIDQGLTRPEALGVPSDFPELLAPRLQAAVRDALAPLA